MALSARAAVPAEFKPLAAVYSPPPSLAERVVQHDATKSRRKSNGGCQQRPAFQPSRINIGASGQRTAAQGGKRALPKWPSMSGVDVQRTLRIAAWTSNVGGKRASKVCPGRLGIRPEAGLHVARSSMSLEHGGSFLRGDDRPTSTGNRRCPSASGRARRCTSAAACLTRAAGARSSAFCRRLGPSAGNRYADKGGTRDCRA